MGERGEVLNAEGAKVAQKTQKERAKWDLQIESVVYGDRRQKLKRRLREAHFGFLWLFFCALCVLSRPSRPWPDY
jgi:hypothetical protein